MATLGGGIIVPDKLLADYIRLTGQTMIFSGPIQPATLGALIASVKLHLADELTQWQDELKGLITYFRKRSVELDLPITTRDETPIQLLRIGDMDRMFRVLTSMIDRGYLPMTASYPAIAKGEEGIRITITRHLSRPDIDGFLTNLKEAIESENL
jgi:7-keto-8-aminopelargonate synthetase-like enzyme